MPKNLIPDAYMDLLERPLLAILATIMPDGSPQATPLWFDFDGQYIRVNSAKGRVKDRNMRRDPRVALVIVDDRTPYRYIQIRGRVVEIIEGDIARLHIDELSRRYTGQDWDSPADEERAIYCIRPERVSAMG